MSLAGIVELFLHARADAGVGDDLPSSELDDEARVVELCELLDWWPPAVRLAGRRAAVQTVSELLEAIASRALEIVLDPAGDEREAGTIAEAVTAALGSLAERERELLVEIAPLRDWWTLDEMRHLVERDTGSFTTLTALIKAEIVVRRQAGDVTLFKVRRAFQERLGPSLTLPCVASLRRAAREVVEGMLDDRTRAPSATDWHAVVGRRRRDLEQAARLSLTDDPMTAGELVLAICMFDAEYGDLARDLALLDRCVATVGALVDTASPESAWLFGMLRGYRLHRRAESVDATTDLAQLAADFDHAVVAATALDDVRVTLAVMAHSVRSARTIGHFDQAGRHAASALELAEQHNMPVAVATFELLAAMVAHSEQRFADAAHFAVRAHTHARRLGLGVSVALASLMFRQLPAGTPNLPKVVPSLDDVLELVEASPAGRATLGVTYGLAVESFFTVNFATAARASATGIRIADRISLPAGVGTGVMIAVVLAAATGDSKVAAHLHGGVSDELDVLLHGASPEYQGLYLRCVEAARSALGEERFDAETRRGTALTQRSLTDRALRFLDGLASPTSAPATSPELAVLSRREIEVLTLLAAGTSNKKIATNLGISPKTVMHHTSNIYRKLGVQGRVEAAALAHRAGLTL